MTNLNIKAKLQELFCENNYPNVECDKLEGDYIACKAEEELVTKGFNFWFVLGECDRSLVDIDSSKFSDFCEFAGVEKWILHQYKGPITFYLRLKTLPKE